MTVLNTADKVRLGSQLVDTVYAGTNKVWPSWTPATVPGLVVWLDASQLPLADGAGVSPWPDLSGKGNNGTIVGSPAPAVRANALKGQRVVRFKMNEGRVRGNNGLSSSGMANPTYNFSIAYITRLWGPNVGRAFSALYPPANMLVGFHTQGIDCAYDGGSGSDGGWVKQGTAWQPAPSPWKLYSYTAFHDGTSYTAKFYRDGVLFGTQGPGGGAGMGNNYSLSGYDANATQETCDIEVAEFLIYSRRITDLERVAVENYLRSKWLA